MRNESKREENYQKGIYFVNIVTLLLIDEFNETFDQA